MEARDAAAGEECFARPPLVLPELGECGFYHTIDLPIYGLQLGKWDLRSGIEAYLGPAELRGRRVLEIGTSNGYVCFELERRGAEVVAFDLDETRTFDVNRPISEEVRRDHLDGIRRRKNAWWLTHRLLGSRARVAYGHVNHLPAGLGEFDVGFIGNVLQHLQDPVGAVFAVAQRCRSIVITEADWMAGRFDDLCGMVFYDAPGPFSWYQVKPRLLEAALRRFGFDGFQLSRHTQLFLEDTRYVDGARLPARVQQNALPIPHFTLTAHRSN